MANVIGVDLGTTNSVMAHIDELGKPSILHNSEGSNMTPSAVEIEGKKILVGIEAKKEARFKKKAKVEKR